MAVTDLNALTLVGAVLIWFIVFGIISYVYQALAWSTIAKKLKYKKHWLAWIPFASFFLMPILAKKKWTWGFVVLLFFFTSIQVLGWILYIIALVFSLYWMTIIFKRRKYSPWLVILMVIPLVNFVMIGFLAWANRK
jgi:hypothetical protein